MTRVLLNVGGKKMETTTSTLLKYPETFLGRMFAPENERLRQKDDSGAYFFDRDGDLFQQFILSVYRSGFPRCLPTDPHRREQILQEYDFWQLLTYYEQFRDNIVDTTDMSPMYRDFYSDEAVRKAYEAESCDEDRARVFSPRETDSFLTALHMCSYSVECILIKIFDKFSSIQAVETAKSPISAIQILYKSDATVRLDDPCGDPLIGGFISTAPLRSFLEKTKCAAAYPHAMLFSVNRHTTSLRLRTFYGHNDVVQECVLSLYREGQFLSVLSIFDWLPFEPSTFHLGLNNPVRVLTAVKTALLRDAIMQITSETDAFGCSAVKFHLETTGLSLKADAAGKRKVQSVSGPVCRDVVCKNKKESIDVDAKSLRTFFSQIPCDCDQSSVSSVLKIRHPNFLVLFMQVSKCHLHVAFPAKFCLL